MPEVGWEGTILDVVEPAASSESKGHGCLLLCKVLAAERMKRLFKSLGARVQSRGNGRVLGKTDTEYGETGLGNPQ